MNKNKENTFEVVTRDKFRRDQADGLLDPNQMYIVLDDFVSDESHWIKECLNTKDKLEKCIAAMKTVINNTEEFATKKLLLDILEKVDENNDKY